LKGNKEMTNAQAKAMTNQEIAEECLFYTECYKEMRSGRTMQILGTLELAMVTKKLMTITQHISAQMRRLSTNPKEDAEFLEMLEMIGA
jgi:hypothetical protein